MYYLTFMYLGLYIVIIKLKGKSLVRCSKSLALKFWLTLIRMDYDFKSKKLNFYLRVNFNIFCKKEFIEISH